MMTARTASTSRPAGPQPPTNRATSFPLLNCLECNKMLHFPHWAAAFRYSLNRHMFLFCNGIAHCRWLGTQTALVGTANLREIGLFMDHRVAILRRQRGFSIIEMVVVVAIVLIVTATSIPLVNSSIKFYQLQSAVASVTGVIRSTRFQAV